MFFVCFLLFFQMSFLQINQELNPSSIIYVGSITTITKVL